MIEILQWSTLAVCGLIAAARVPSALRGENRSLFYIFALLTAAILLSIEAPYTAVDRALGGINLTNLLLRFIIFAAIFFVGIRITRGFGANGAYQLITGKTGKTVLLAISVVLVLLFILIDTTGSSAGLAAPSAKSERNFNLVQYYGAAGRAYPAFVSLALLPAMVRALRSRLPMLLRVAAGLLTIGSAAITLTLLFPLFPPAWNIAKYVLNYSAVLCFVIGLTLIWASRVRSSQPAKPSKTHTDK